MMIKIITLGIMTVLIPFFPVAFSNASAVENLTIEKSLTQAFAANSELAAFQARANSERALVKSQYWLDNPKIGYMHENNLNLMQVQMGPMNSWSITQEIKFPTKYFLLGSAQSSRADGAQHEFEQKKLEIRKKTILAYYNLFTTDRILALLDAQKETLREVARSAEIRRSTGAVPQQDEMKAHVEQTKIETEIILTKQDYETNLSEFNALLNRDVSLEVSFGKTDPETPTIVKTLNEIKESAHTTSRNLKNAHAQFEVAAVKKSLAAWNFAPDFNLFYRKAWTNTPSDNFAVGIELIMPLWFFVKQSSEYSAASLQALEAEKMLQKQQRDLESKVRSLSLKVNSFAKLLKIYESALVPQATSTLNSSRSAYQAGRTTFLELLDSERSLYSVRMAYYRTLLQLVDNIVQLEENVGHPISTLPFGDVI
jgi:cobalt-zinc-cadmium efflux system outer membrane protein